MQTYHRSAYISEKKQIAGAASITIAMLSASPATFYLWTALADRILSVDQSGQQIEEPVQRDHYPVFDHIGVAGLMLAVCQIDTENYKDRFKNMDYSAHVSYPPFYRFITSVFSDH